MTSTNRKLHVVDDEQSKRKPRRWKSNAEHSRLPLVNQHGELVVPSLPEQGHEELERLIGKQVKGDK